MSKKPLVNSLALTSTAASLTLSARTSDSLIQAQQDAILKQKMIRIAISDVAAQIEPQLTRLITILHDLNSTANSLSNQLAEALVAHADAYIAGKYPVLINMLTSFFPDCKPTASAGTKYIPATTEKGKTTDTAHLLCTHGIDIPNCSTSYRANPLSITTRFAISNDIASIICDIESTDNARSEVTAEISDLQAKRTKILTSAPTLELEMDRALLTGNADTSKALASITASLAQSIGLPTTNICAPSPTTPRKRV